MNEEITKSQIVAFQGWPLRVDITDCISPITIKQTIAGACISDEGIEACVDTPEITISVSQAEWLIDVLHQAIKAVDDAVV